MNLKILKILSIFAPAIFIAIFEALRHTIFEESRPMIIGNILVLLTVTVAAYFFSKFVFGKIEQMQKERLRRNLELEALNSVALSVNESLKLNVVLQRSMEKVLSILNAEAGEIFLLDEKVNEMVQRLHSGLFADAFAEKTRFKFDEGFVGYVARTGEAMLIQDLSTDSRLIRKGVKDRGFHSLASAPLKVNKKVIGVINVYGLKPELFGADDIGLLKDMGNQIALAIENACLHEKVETLAALEERERIARDMHDGLAQVLSYTLTKSQAARQLLACDQQLKANVQLMELETGVQDVYADVRETILGLRTTAVQEAGLIPVLSEYITRFTQISGVKTELKIEDEKPYPLSPKTEFQIVCIVQEALTNVRKHAGASNASVHIKYIDDSIEIIVKDDGKGFDRSEVNHSDFIKFGFQTMTERAERIKGTLGVSSKSGEGTTVKLRVPCTSFTELGGL